MKAPKALVETKLSGISRIANRKYTEIVLEELELRGWKISDLAKEADKLFPEFKVTPQDAYEYMDCADVRTSTSKIFEWTLGVNLPPHCYWNAGKRK